MRPAPNAEIDYGPPEMAVAKVAGVTVRVQTEAWKGVPRDIKEIATPLLVSIENGSGRPMRVRFSEMWLDRPDGLRLAALPPMRMEGSEIIAGPIRDAGFSYWHYYLAPWYHRAYPTFPIWSNSFALDPGYYGQWYGRWRVDLPTLDMVRKALPEGVLVDGHATGFVYFEELPNDTHSVDFHLELVDADTEQPFGRVTIPLVVTD